jgi:hypothetical protein
VSQRKVIHPELVCPSWSDVIFRGRGTSTPEGQTGAPRGGLATTMLADPLLSSSCAA